MRYVPKIGRVSENCKACGNRLYSVYSFLGIDAIRIGDDRVTCSNCHAEYRHLFRNEYVDTPQTEKILYRLGFWCMPKVGIIEQLVDESYGESIPKVILKTIFLLPLIILVYGLTWLIVFILHLFPLLNLFLIYYQNKEIKESIKRKPRRNRQYKQEYEESLPSIECLERTIEIARIKRITKENEEEREMNNLFQRIENSRRKKGLFQSFQRYTYPKLMYILTSFLVIGLVIFAAIGIPQLKYATYVITTDNYQDIVRIEPEIILTRYFVEEEENPVNYLYHVDLHMEYIVEMDVSPVFLIQYRIEGDDLVYYSNELDFETEAEISSVKVIIQTGYREKVKVLRSFKNQIEHLGNSLQEYPLDIKLNQFYYKEMNITENNYWNFLEVIVNNPSFYGTLTSYHHTEYTITYNILDHVVEINFLNVDIGYCMYDDPNQSTFTVNDVVHFTLRDTIKENTFGAYRYYVYTIQSIEGRALVELPER